MGLKNHSMLPAVFTSFMWWAPAAEDQQPSSALAVQWCFSTCQSQRCRRPVWRAP